MPARARKKHSLKIEALAPGCHFRDCTHTKEKDCAVLAAVAAGALPRERHESFVKLQLEISYLANPKNRPAANPPQERPRGPSRLQQAGLGGCTPLGVFSVAPDGGW